MTDVANATRPDRRSRRAAAKTSASSPAPASYTDDIDAARARPTPCSCARRTRTRASARSTPTRRRRRPASSPSSPATTAEAKVGGLPCGWLIHSKDGTPMKEPPHPVLRTARCATSATRSRWSSPRRSTQAKDAAELIEVDYEELPAGDRHGDAPTAGAGGARRGRPTTSATTGATATRPRSTRPSPRPRT